MSSSPAFFYDDAQFRGWFSAFANTSTYPKSLLQECFDAAGFYIANSQFGPLARAKTTLWCLYLMTAHLAQIMTAAIAGQTTGTVVGATIDKITVQLQQFQYPNQWELWLSSTLYGQQLLALLQVQSVGGFSVPAGSGRAGFRW